MKLLLHTIATFGPNAINKDENGDIKSVQHLGYQAQRVSSQCVKRAMRTRLHSLGWTPARRVTNIELWRHICELMQPETHKEYIECCKKLNRITSGAAGSPTKNDYQKLNKAMGMSPEELSAIESEDDQSESGDSKGPSVTMHFVTDEEWNLTRADGSKATLTPDIAMAGRMVPASDDTVNGALFTAGWMGVTEMLGGEDYYTASSDMSTGAAANIGYVSFSSGAVMYGFHGIDLDILRENLPHFSSEQLAKLVADTVRALIEAEPTGGTHNFPGVSAPSFALTEMAARNQSAIEEFSAEAATNAEDAVERLQRYLGERRGYEFGFDGPVAVGGRQAKVPFKDFYQQVNDHALDYYRG